MRFLRSVHGASAFRRIVTCGMSLRFSLLALLSEGRLYGQQLRAEFEARTGELWPLNAGHVYSTLNRLERDGLVVAEGPKNALRPYTITPDGEAALASWFQAPASAEPPRDDLVMKVMIAVSLDPTRAVQVIESHRRELLDATQHFALLKAGDDSTPATHMMCDAELLRLEACVRWLDSVDERLRSGERLDVPVGQAAVTVTPGASRSSWHLRRARAYRQLKP